MKCGKTIIAISALMLASLGVAEDAFNLKDWSLKFYDGFEAAGGSVVSPAGFRGQKPSIDLQLIIWSLPIFCAIGILPKTVKRMSHFFFSRFWKSIARVRKMGKLQNLGNLTIKKKIIMEGQSVELGLD